VCLEARVVLELHLCLGKSIPAQGGTNQRFQRELNSIATQVLRTIEPVVLSEYLSILQAGLRDSPEIADGNHIPNATRERCDNHPIVKRRHPRSPTSARGATREDATVSRPAVKWRHSRAGVPAQGEPARGNAAV